MLKINVQDQNEIKLTWNLNIGKLELTINNEDKKVYAVVIKSNKKFFIQDELLTGIPTGLKKTQDVQGIKQLFDQVYPQAEYLDRIDNYAIHFEKRINEERVKLHSEKEALYEDIRKYGTIQDEMTTQVKQDLQERKEKHTERMQQMYQDLDYDLEQQTAGIGEINKQTQTLSDKNADLERQIAEMQAAMKKKESQDQSDEECPSCNIL